MIQRNCYASFWNNELPEWNNKKKSGKKNWHQDNSKYTPEIIKYNPRTYTRRSFSALGTRFACATESLKAQIDPKVTQSPGTSHCRTASSVSIHLHLTHSAPLTRDKLASVNFHRDRNAGPQTETRPWIREEETSKNKSRITIRVFFCCFFFYRQWYEV